MMIRKFEYISNTIAKSIWNKIPVYYNEMTSNIDVQVTKSEECRCANRGYKIEVDPVTILFKTEIDVETIKKLVKEYIIGHIRRKPIFDEEEAFNTIIQCCLEKPDEFYELIDSIENDDKIQYTIK